MRHSKPDSRVINFFIFSVLLLSSGCRPAATPSGMRHVRDPHTFDNKCWVTELHVAVRDGDVNLVQSMIANGANVTVVDWKGDPPLLEFVYVSERERQEEHLQIIRLLVAAGADVNQCVDHHGVTALKRAAGDGWPELVSTLLELGAKVDGTSDGMTPLLMAAGYYTGKPTEDVIDILIQNGANLDAKTNRGETILDIAKGALVVSPNTRAELIKYIESKMQQAAVGKE